MNKSTNFTGQPILAQLLSLIDKSSVSRIAKKRQSDRYSKYFKTWDHLVTMLYSTLCGATALRELTTGLLAGEGKLRHLGLMRSCRRSTLSDSNKRRSSEVFREVYMDLYRKWHHVLSDSRIELELFKQLYIVDSTVFSLFKDILKVAGRRKDGRSKGGIKAHTLVHAVELMPCLVRFTAATTHDHTFLQHINLPEGSYIVMDKGYVDYHQYQLWSNTGVYYITRMRDNALYQSIEEFDIPDHVDEGVIKDEKVIVQYLVEGKKYDHLQRRVAYWDDKNQRLFIFITNDMQTDAGLRSTNKCN